MSRNSAYTVAALALAMVCATGRSADALIININPNTSLASNTDALAAFNGAADQWEAIFSDSIEVNIAAGLADLGTTGIIANAGSVELQAGYDLIRDQMVLDAADEFDDAVVAALPTAATFTVAVPIGFGLNGNLSLTKANAKAIGFTGLDTSFGTNDATITFNSQFSFDYNNADGVTAGTMDFETVAAHEIGHALGFISDVDFIDVVLDANGTSNQVQPTTLDLFRFDNDGANDPSTIAQFGTMPRSMVPGNDEIFDSIDLEARMSTGREIGDGQQASHFKDGLGLGVMDPTLSFGQVVPISQYDIRAFDVIGWDVITAVPEPVALSLLAALAPLALRRRRAAR
jgi:hypothetical protein